MGKLRIKTYFHRNVLLRMHYRSSVTVFPEHPITWSVYKVTSGSVKKARKQAKATQLDTKMPCTSRSNTRLIAGLFTPTSVVEYLFVNIVSQSLMWQDRYPHSIRIAIWHSKLISTNTIMYTNTPTYHSYDG